MQPDSNQQSSTSGTRRIIERPVGSSGLGRTRSSTCGRCRSVTVTPKSRSSSASDAVDVDARVRGVVALPHRDRRAPEPVAADGPVAGVRQPLAEAAVLDVLGHPGDLLVQLDHAVAERGDLHEPRADRAVDERLGAPPAVRVRVLVGVVAHDEAARLEVLDDLGVGVEHVHAGPRRRPRRCSDRARPSGTPWGCRPRCRRSGPPRRSRAPCARRRCRPRC